MRTYIMLGMGRSGTSFLAECLKKNGVNIGEYFYMGENPNHGYENQELVDITKEIISVSGKSWGIDSIPAEKEDIEKSYNNNRKRIKSFIHKNKDKSWGVKEPRLSLMLDEFMEDIAEIDDDPFLYVAFRKPENVAKSLVRLNSKIEYGEALEAAKEYNRRLIKSLSNFIGI